MSRVLVTGASGFIGHKTALYFLNNGYDVVGWNRSEGNNEFPIQKVDLADEDELLRQLFSVNPDIIIHCAGAADVGKSVKDPTMDYHGNVTITHNLLFALHKAGMEKTRVVFLSSAGVYGNPAALPITENMPLNPLSPYAVHKVMCEEFCKYFVNNYGMNVKVARIFSAYGAGLKKQIFWDMYQKMKNTVMDEVRRIFKPEFLNRVDDIVTFGSLNHDCILKIVDIELASFYKRVEENGLKLHITDAAKNLVADLGFDIQYGARPLKRAIQSEIEDPLSEMLLREEAKQGDTIVIDAVDGKIATSITKAAVIDNVTA